MHGLGTLILRETARYQALASPDLVRGVWAWSNRVIAIYGGAIAIAVGCMLLVSNSYGQPMQLRVMAFALPLVPLLGLCSVRGAALRGLGRIAEGQIIESILAPALFLLALIGLWGQRRAQLPPEAALLSYAISVLLAVIAGQWMLDRRSPTSLRIARPTWQSRVWFRSLAPLATLAFLGSLNGQITSVLLALFHPPEQVGLYRAATQLALFTIFGLVVINAVLPPQFASLHAIRDHERLQKLAILSARLSLTFAASVTLLLVFTGDFLLDNFFGPSFTEAYIPLLILVFGQVVNASCGSVGFLLNMCQREHDALLAHMLAIAINFVLGLAFIPKFGLVAACIVTSLSVAVWNVSMVILLAMRTGCVSLPVSVVLKDHGS
jgi:O-antigen/teichoic acid export membrane protein